MTESLVDIILEKMPLAYPDTGNKALFRQQPEYFNVTEELNFVPRGEGDHLYLNIEKSNTNTDWLAEELARKSSIKPADVGYAGRKDRFAVTRQWFSLHLPESKMIDPVIFQGTDYRIIEQSRHTHKLRKGEIACNRFKLQLTSVEGCIESFKERAELLSRQGFPNYFGPQRFGHQGANIEKARSMLSGKVRVNDRNKRSIYLSAARSYLFNLVLARRIETDCWQSPISGDQFWDEQCSTSTTSIKITDELVNKLEQGQISITGPMFGDGPSPVTDNCLLLESDVFQSEQSLCHGIANSRVKWHRRSLRVLPKNFTCRENKLGIVIEFSLPTGCYATSLLRELISG